MATITTPIWKDCFAEILSAGSAIPFRVRANSTSGDIIYTGAAMPRPGESVCRIRLNDIAADYLTHTVPNLGTAAFAALSFPVKFYVETFTAGVWAFLSDDWAFLMDWSYDPLYVLASPITAPVTMNLSPLQYVLKTVYNVASVSATFHFSDGTTATDTIDLTGAADFDASFNRDFARSLRSAGSGTASFKIADHVPVGKTCTGVTIDGEYFDVLDGCDYRYVLYYLNAYGGWDSLLMQGTPKRTDSLDRNTSEVSYDNRGVMNRGRKDYAIDIKRRYALRTGMLTDDEASRMWHLLESTDVYMHDTLTGEVRPVVLTDSECEFQTFYANGGRMSQYTVNMEIAQVFERR